MVWKVQNNAKCNVVKFDGVLQKTWCNAKSNVVKFDGVLQEIWCNAGVKMQNAMWSSLMVFCKKPGAMQVSCKCQS